MSPWIPKNNIIEDQKNVANVSEIFNYILILYNILYIRTDNIGNIVHKYNEFHY